MWFWSLDTRTTPPSSARASSSTLLLIPENALKRKAFGACCRRCQFLHLVPLHSLVGACCRRRLLPSAPVAVGACCRRRLLPSAPVAVGACCRRRLLPSAPVAVGASSCTSFPCTPSSLEAACSERWTASAGGTATSFASMSALRNSSLFMSALHRLSCRTGDTLEALRNARLETLSALPTSFSSSDWRSSPRAASRWGRGRAPVACWKRRAGSGVLGAADSIGRLE